MTPRPSSTQVVLALIALATAPMSSCSLIAGFSSYAGPDGGGDDADAEDGGDADDGGSDGMDGGDGDAGDSGGDADDCAATCEAPTNGTAVCVDGTCFKACSSTHLDCDGLSSNGCETLSDDVCGACSDPCESDSEVCSDGECIDDCPEGEEPCSGICVDVQTSTLHCGSCGDACTPLTNTEAECVAGACTRECLADYGDCDEDGLGCEVYLPEACGACDPCPEGEICAGGACAEGTCDSRTEIVCNDVCVAPVRLYDDADRDSFGTGEATDRCPSTGAAEDGDCNDSDVTVNPAAIESCDGVDSDCDPLTGGDSNDDGDSFMVCEGDCNDDAVTGGSVYPGAVEACDGVDTDCAEGAGDDEDDEDGDGQMICEGDCDDDSVTGGDNYLGNAEMCDGADNNCDAIADNDATNGIECVQSTSGSCMTECDSIGTEECSLECSLQGCVPPEETCNGIDDDCDIDGAIDNGFFCALGDTTSCDTSCEPGESTGTQACASTCLAWDTTCTPPGETCDWADNDCDGGYIDNGLLEQLSSPDSLGASSSGLLGLRADLSRTDSDLGAVGAAAPSGVLYLKMFSDGGGETDETFSLGGGGTGMTVSVKDFDVCWDGHYSTVVTVEDHRYPTCLTCPTIRYVRAYRFSGSGSPAWVTVTNQSITGDTTIPGPPPSIRCAAAEDGSSGAYLVGVVWVDTTTSPPPVMYATIFADGSTSLGSPDGPHQLTYGGAVGIEGTGDSWSVVWSEPTRLRRVKTAGTSWSATDADTQNLETMAPTGSGIDTLRTTFDASTEALIVAYHWGSMSPGGDRGWGAGVFTAGTPQDWALTSDADSAMDLSLAATEQDTFAISWLSGTVVEFRRYLTSTGSPYPDSTDDLSVTGAAQQVMFGSTAWSGQAHYGFAVATTAGALTLQGIGCTP